MAVVVVSAVAIGGLIGPRLVGNRSTASLPASAAQPAAVVDAAPTPSTSASAGSAPPVAIAAPLAASWGVPVGYPQSPAGVRAAAVTWVAAFGDLMAMGPIARNDTLRQLLSQHAFNDTLEQFRADRDRFTTLYHSDLSQAMWVDAPLSVEILSAEATRAQVEVWSVLMFGTLESRVEMLWRTQQITLVWDQDSWRVDDVIRRDGPTPILGADAMSSTGTDFADVAVWMPAVLAGTSVG